MRLRTVLKSADFIAVLCLLAGTQIWPMAVLGLIVMAIQRPYVGMLVGTLLDIAYGPAPFFVLPIPFTALTACIIAFAYLGKKSGPVGEAARIGIGR